MVKARIESSALGQLILSAYAVLNRETCGVLIGTKPMSDTPLFIVESVFPLQEAYRTEGGVGIDDREFDRIVALFPIVGGYHSHVKSRVQRNGVKYVDPGRVFLGKYDRNFVKNFYPNGIEIVVSLNETNRAFKYRLGKNKLSGCFRDNRESRFYRIDMSAYTLQGDRKSRADLEIDKASLKSHLLY